MSTDRDRYVARGEKRSQLDMAAAVAHFRRPRTNDCSQTSTHAVQTTAQFMMGNEPRDVAMFPDELSGRPGPSVLLIDDDAELRALMAEFLTQHGCRVSVAADGQDGLARALSGEHDLVTLDVMLPIIDGFELLRQLRRRSRVPVIVLTARTSAEDRISGLEGGADDYLPKPFHAAELLARIRAVLRRTGFADASPSDVAEAGGVIVNAQSRQGSCQGVPLVLTSIEFDILDLLVRSAGRVVSRDQLAVVLYQRQASPYERSVDVHVSHLRKKLQAAGRDLIRTVRGAGYLFAREA